MTLTVPGDYSHTCHGAGTMVMLYNYNRRRNPCHKLLERAACLVASEIRQLPAAAKRRVTGGGAPSVIGISLHSETDVGWVQYRGLPTRRGRAFPLATPLCPARPGFACIHWASPRGAYWFVMVCSDLALREARRRRIPYREELIRYFIHSLLHLAGERDRHPRSAERMFRHQEALIDTALGRRAQRRGRMDKEISAATRA